MSGLSDPYLSHWLAYEDQPYYPEDADVFRLYEPNGRQVTAWEPGEHIPCWLDFLPNRDARATFHLRRGTGPPTPVNAGALRQSIRKVIWSLVP